ncbi:ATP-dependent nuclease [Bacillus toyonensis]|uniref:ATP-dependent nuclease n=1 Tax=Bacillus toyonensis TaxID=155322 RepID=UPI000BED48BA|nr:AAA family ATPase [Bacillus toyonensis]PDZ86113.1 ATP-dependent endonuclease [Bacillus toyonensis]PEA71053.1 ATP-dependent endonuclease [Bacillus toyonensis]
MYLHSLKLWNWRKFSEGTDGQAGIEVEFQEGLNILVGENDSGKTAIIDAIKMVLGTNSNDMNWVTEHDFHKGSTTLKIECVFRKLSKREEAYFYEWLTIQSQKSELRVVLEAEIYDDINRQKKIRRSIKAGPENLEMAMEDTVRQLLAVTYLKPLRDATTELSSGNRSRVAQIIKSLKDFADNGPEKEQIVGSFSNAFDELKAVLHEPVLSKIGSTVDEFFEENNKKEPEIRNREMSFSEILRKLELNLGETGTGLGSSNLLFMAVELLLLNETEIGPKVALIEEIEAHIHPQAQLRVIKHFERDVEETNIQYIFTSHSPILAASVSLENIIFIYGNQAYSMKKGNTKLEGEDYEFLERFLDATKANLFFARGVIFVEGDAENLLLPAIAEVIERPLHKYGVSIINVGNLAFKRYSSIFIRADENKQMNFPVSIITDLDLKPVEYYQEPCYIKINEEIHREIANLYGVEELNYQFAEGIYVQLKDLIKKSKNIYGYKIKECYSEGEQKQKFEDIKISLELLLKSIEPSLDAYKKIKENDIKQRYYNDIEQTKIFISHPWTLEHSIASSGLSEEFEDILLEINYTKEENREKQKALWEEINDKSIRATQVYSFLLDKEISKAIVAQKFAKYLIDHKRDLKRKLLEDESLKHLVDAIKHVTGGEDVAV